MDNFPVFVRNPANLIRARDQHTPGIVGYVFDGADGSQIALWTQVAAPRRSLVWTPTTSTSG
jgi:hypothetical protein